jgi:hypothetical protein
VEEPEVVEASEILGSGQGGPTSIADLNAKAIQKLADLLDGLGGKSDPSMITAVTDAVAKLNTSLKGSDILPKEETPEQRRERELQESLAKAMKG